MLSRAAFKPRRQNSHRADSRKRCPQFLQWLRGRPCACGGRNPNCGGKIQAAHGPDKGSKGVSTKCLDSCAMPLSANCHALQHNIGWISFGISYLGTRDMTSNRVLQLCAEYWQAWPGRIAWLRKMEAAHGA